MGAVISCLGGKSMADFDALAAKNSALENEKAQLEATKTQLATAKAVLETQYGNLEKQHAALGTQKDQVAQDKKQLEILNQINKVRVQGLESAKTGLEETRAALERAVQTKSTHAEFALKAKKQVELSARRAHAVKSKMQAAVMNQEKAQNQKHSEDIDVLRRYVEMLESEILEHQSYAKTLEEGAAALKANLSALEAELQAERDVRASSVMMLYEELTVTSDRNIALHQHAAENVKQRQAVVFREMQDAAAEADARKQRLTAMMAEALSEQVGLLEAETMHMRTLQAQKTEALSALPVKMRAKGVACTTPSDPYSVSTQPTFNPEESTNAAHAATVDAVVDSANSKFEVSEPVSNQLSEATSVSDVSLKMLVDENEGVKIELA